MASSSYEASSEMAVHVPRTATRFLMGFSDAGAETAPFRKTLGGCDEC